MKKKRNQKSLDVIARLSALTVVTIRKLVIMSVLIVGGVTFATAQVLSPAVVASSGNSNTGADCILNWTLGEIAGNTFSQTSVILTQGFQQNFLDLGTKIEEIENTFGNGFSIFPVPAKEFLNLTITSPSKDAYQLEIFNARGTKVWNTILNAFSSSERIDISELSSGVYALKISEPQGKIIKTIKFVKQ